jgi:transcriptional regulator with XRE-family HTH domain
MGVAMEAPKLPSKQGFGETLRAMRKERGLTLGDVAEKAGLTTVAVSDLERGRQKDITTVPLYLHALGLDSRTKLLLGACAESAWNPWHRRSTSAVVKP